MIEINELTKYYGEAKAVGPLSFRVDKGEVIGLLGLNGAGKTTTLRMLSSELLPTSGEMLIDGVNLADEPEKLREKIGYLPDRPPVYGEMRVREYLTFAAELRNVARSKLKRRVDEVLEITDLTRHTEQRIDTLSHGYRQRVGIGQAIIHEPSMLLLDEPISGLDPVQIVEMRQLIRSLRGEHITIVSSHILSEISETCDRLLVIRGGEIIASGSEADLTAQMTSVYRFELSLRVPEEVASEHGGAAAAAQSIIEQVEDITNVDSVPADEQGECIARLRVLATADVREQVCKKAVLADCGILRLERSARELESVFMELTGADERRVP